MNRSHLVTSMCALAGIVVVGVATAPLVEAAPPGSTGPTPLAPSGKPPPKVTPPTEHYDCLRNGDHDGDGHAATIPCGGDDCDDHDPHRFPGNVEVCWMDGNTHQRIDPTHDEDCDPTSFSNLLVQDGDLDGDGRIDVTCRNQDARGYWHMGTDCDDSNPAIVPGAMECDGASSVQICSPPRWSGYGGVPVPTIWQTATCPRGGHCIAQPNGTGSCSN